MDLADLCRAAGLAGETLLVIDDAHWLEGSPAEAALAHALEHAPPTLHTVLGSRRLPALNLCRHELDGLAVIDADQLRFRSWETEQLLRDVYREPLPPEDTAALARRVGGWVAGLHMFHLSTRGRPLAQRRAAVAALTGRASMSRSYLARTVIAELPGELPQFLTRTAVFDVLTAERCDRLLGRRDSRAKLAELARLQAFTTSDDGGGSYRYHEAMRSHLAVSLSHELGEPAARDWYARAGALLAEEGAYAEAARAYAHAEDWPTVRRLLDRLGPELVEGGVEPWRDLLPAWLVADDPWMEVAEGQHAFSRGQLAAAIGHFQRAEQLFSTEDGRAHCRLAMSRARAWLPGPARPDGPWWHWLRAATQRQPAQVAQRARQLPEPAGQVVRTIAYALAGQVTQARRLLREADLSHPGFAGLVLRCLYAAAEHADQPGAITGQLADAAAEAERSQAPWLARMVRAAAALDGSEQGAKAALAVADECRRDGDRWGTAIATGLAWLSHRGRDRAALGALAELVSELRGLDAAVLQAWASRLLARAAAEAGHPEAVPLAGQAVAVARRAGVREPAPLAGVREPAPLAGVREPAPLAGTAYGPGPRAGTPPPVEIRCLGGFRAYLDGEQLAVARVRPRARTLLRLLALHTGRPLHREVLVEALWPGLAAGAATHNLHVALSSLRRLLESAQAGREQLLVRDGDAYCLVLPAGGHCDVASLQAALDQARRARLSGDPAATVAALRYAVASYGGELLPEDGAAEWVTAERDRLRAGVVEAAASLAVLALESHDTAAAIAAAERCLDLDRFQDQAWRVLVRAYQRDRNVGAAERAARRYAEALGELGLTPPPRL